MKLVSLLALAAPCALTEKVQLVRGSKPSTTNLVLLDPETVTVLV